MNKPILLAPSPAINADPGGDGAAQVQDPGTIDNRLSLDPSDERWKDKLAALADGEPFTITLKCSGISPGEAEVTDVVDVQAGDGAEPKPGDDEAAEPAPDASETDNPAVANLMKE